MTTLKQLAKEVAACSRCPLREGATAPVMGCGEVGAKYFLIGEAPGRNEDLCGIPFVGVAGQRLDRLLSVGKIDKNLCYLTNTVKCRPPKNRVPKKSERVACYLWLRQELSLIKPEIIIPLGATPLSLFTETGISQLHGTIFTYDLDVDD